MTTVIKYLSPFAPDISGAVSVLFELGGLIVICDAGGCTGNVCGFDEPRWFQKKSAIFSAGLRDMDAILGCDERLISKLQDAVSKTDAAFTAIIGTPVPAVIGTDFRALKHMAEKRTGLPALTVETSGAGLYDEGEENAMLALFQNFATEAFPVKRGTVGVLGVTPLEFSNLRAGDIMAAAVEHSGLGRAVCYGMGSGLDSVQHASAAEKNLVVSPAGLKTAEYLKTTFGTPYIIDCPLISEDLNRKLTGLAGKRVLVIHQQVLANSVRNRILAGTDADVAVASWFMLKDDLKQEGDFRLTDELRFAAAVEDGGYDVIIGDSFLKRALRHYHGQFIDFPHFAVSGRLEE
ncbi:MULTISPECIES: nitrogenase component 1 [Clostridium]|jgi:nitrogenase molybdenum-iron protein alpha/beta subunit|uniref:Nitrogenase component 1 n=1 Tax=Clostridium lapidicellarium TaxID=3240931 RepID=A0ABV4DYH2_9CLOT|nr:nitrogenase molybdenum-iron protein [Clostridiales bacterium]